MGSSANDLPRDFVDRFRVEAKIGHGGMGTVYKAYDTVLQRTVAVKTLTPGNADAQGVQRLLREARACARLTHPDIVTIHDVLETEDRVHIVMEYLAGASLESLHKFPRFTSCEAKVGIVIRILAALHYAHGRGVVHRDVKPRNVQILPDGSVKLLDFGIAHVAGVDALTITGSATGTAHYASPEQLRGEESGACTDVYSTGILAYEILTRRRPFDGDSVASVLAKVLHDPLPPMDTSWSESFPDIEHIVRRAAAKRIQDRYASAEDMKNALAAFLASSREAIVRKQAELVAKTEWVVIEAKSLMASGRMAEAKPLLTSALRSNPDAEEVRTLLRAGTNAAGMATAPPAARQTGAESTLLIGSDGLARFSQSGVEPASATRDSADGSLPASRQGWPRTRLLVVSASALIGLVGVILFGPSWMSRESLGAGLASESADSLPRGPAAGLPSARVDSGTLPASTAPPAPEAEVAARRTELPATPAEASSGTVTHRSAASSDGGREGVAPSGAAAGSDPSSVVPSPAATARAPATSLQPENPPPVTTAAGAKELYYAAPAPSSVSSTVSGGTPSAVTAGDDSSTAGIRYRILRRRPDGTPVEVDPDAMFQSGDRIRFAFEPNIDGFLYVIQQGSTGRWSVLLPHPLIDGGRNTVTRFGEVAIPPDGWFRFDENPGFERVFVYLSKDPLSTLPWGGGPVISAQSVDQPTMIELANSVRSRDLVFEKEATPGSTDQAAYVVNRDSMEGAVAWTVELHHR